MSLRIGEEFAVNAVGSEEWWRKHRYLAETGNDAVLTNGGRDRGDHTSSSRRVASTSAMDVLQMLEQQRQREEQIRNLTTRLDDLDRETDEAVRTAQERLADILLNANRTKDGRAVFLDDDGKFYDEHDNEVGTDDIDWDNWNPDAPTWTQFGNAKQTVTDAVALDQKVDGLIARVDEKMTDEEIAQLGNDLRAVQTEVGAFTGASYAGGGTADASLRTTSAAKQYDGEPAALSSSGPFMNAVAPPAVGAPDKAATEPGPATTFVPR